jgi:hypothetical protein
MDSTRPPYPIPPDPEDLKRWEHTRKARRILYGDWRQDLEDRAQQALGHIRREAWKMLDLSANPLRAFMDQLARSYDRPPATGHSDDAGRENLDAVKAARWWVRSQRRLRDTLGLSEMFARVDVLPDGTPTYRLVFPDLVVAEPDLDEPWKPRAIREARLRTHPDGKRLAWTWDVLELGEEPVYRITDEQGRNDWSDAYGLPRDGYEGDAYPYRWPETDEPLLPYPVFHRSDVGALWDWTANRELVEGTEITALYYSFAGHALRSAAWRQKVALDCDIEGADEVDEDGNRKSRSSVITDPATILRMRSVPREDGQIAPQFGSFDVPADPGGFLDFANRYEQRMAQYVGVTGADQLKMSGDPRSGFAVMISRESLREVQTRHQPMSEAGDLDLLAITAALRSRVLGRRIPTTGYSIAYLGIPKTADEKRADREHRLAMIEAGLLDPVLAYLEEHPHLTEAQAMVELDQIAERRRRFVVGASVPSTNRPATDDTNEG